MIETIQAKCAYCGHSFPAPVALHHSSAECARLQNRDGFAEALEAIVVERRGNGQNTSVEVDGVEWEWQPDQASWTNDKGECRTTQEMETALHFLEIGELDMSNARRHMEIMRQQKANAAKHGGPEHDDFHEPKHWRRFIQQEIDSMMPPDMMTTAIVDLENYRARLVKIAAVAMDALASYDRKVGA